MGDAAPAANFAADRLARERWAARDVAGWCQLFDPHRSRYVDPVFGAFEGREAIRRWLTATMRRAGGWRSREAGPRFFDGFVAAGEAELRIPLAGSDLVLPFAWVQRYEDGAIVYRRDYYDTHELRRRVPARALEWGGIVRGGARAVPPQARGA
jgi:ketosteroid isomerase-like protein